MKKLIAAYCRTACAEANDPLSGVRLQETEIAHYAERRGLEIGATYAEAGVSGVTLERPELQRLIADCQAGLIDTVITRDPDRLSRDSGRLFALLLFFRGTGVRVLYSDEVRNNGL